ncbi:HlyC/CorC family transporter [Listeria grandensis]|uniref:HlyC/CorC family transporter n=1 Tax=Listeria grandensis TaxID=1494963 RepID=A0A7X0Y5C9_9LIST|nr:hemolysin family protein [Listeria grandensis]MBC1474737.1 HlyC/CorC family transporter [Listeria grandensis]MBC1937244.1 HlyC/CorC family transporter [Listeria grandensis]
MILTTKFLIIALLIAISAFFVATEFAIVKMRPSRLDQLISEGNKRAHLAKHIYSHMNAYLSACQLGITISSLGLGWLGESTVEAALHPLFVLFELPSSITSVLSFAIAFILITFLHVVVGELVPKTLAIDKTEAVALSVARPLHIFYKVMFPFIWLLNESAVVIAKMFGLETATDHEIAHTEEELRIIVGESYKSGEINQSEFSYVNKIFDFDERMAKEVMIPRTEIVTVATGGTIADLSDIMKYERYTRYPVIEGDKDHIIGVLNLKEILSAYVENGSDPLFSIDPYVKPIIRVIETIPIKELLIRMQRERSHIAILLDEYGGTSGLVTVEDIVEEIVGDIRDEFDADEIPEIRKIKDGHFIIDAKVLIDQVNNMLGTDIEEEEVDTIGGWFLTHNYEVEIGDEIENNGYVFRVKEAEPHHISYIEVFKKETTEE